MNGEPNNPKKGLDEREKAFEAKFQQDEALAFKISVRRTKLLGLWVAEILGLTGDQAAAYAHSAVQADLALPAHRGLLAKLDEDLRAGGHLGDAERLADVFQGLELVAGQQVIAEVIGGKQSPPSNS